MYTEVYYTCITESSLDTGAIIGFENISVSVLESVGVAVLYVAVMNGTLGGYVTVQFSTAKISATGEPYCYLLL